MKSTVAETGNEMLELKKDVNFAFVSSEKVTLQNLVQGDRIACARSLILRYHSTYQWRKRDTEGIFTKS